MRRIGQILVTVVLLTNVSVHHLEAESPSLQGDTFTEPPQRLQSRRSEADEDRLTSAALYAQARMMFRRRDFAEALRRYQRAWRYDPEAVSISQDIIPLAAGLNRKDEAAKYATLVNDTKSIDPKLLAGLAAHLSKQEQWEGAVKLYSQLVELQGEKRSPASVLVHLELGRLFFLIEKFDRSADSFAIVREALEDPKKFGLNDELRKRILSQKDRTFLVMAESFLRANRLEEAEKAYAKSSTSDDNKGAKWFFLARVAQQQKKNDVALAHLDKAFAEQHTDAGLEPFELLEKLYLEAEKDKPAAIGKLVQHLEQLKENHPDFGELKMFLAQKYLEEKQLEKAEALFRDLTDHGLSQLAYGGLATIYVQRKDAERTLETFGGAIKKRETLQSLGEPLDKLVEDKELSRKIVELALKNNAADPPEKDFGPPLAAAHLAVEIGDVDSGIALFDHVKNKPDVPLPKIASTWGLHLFVNEHYEQAAAVFQHAIDEKLDKESEGPLYFYLAGALGLAKKVDEAVTVAKAAIRTNPDSPQFHSRLAWVMYVDKQHEAAENAYAAIIEKFDSIHDPGVRNALRDARLVLSNICVREKRMPEAEEWLEQVLDEFPEEIGALNDLGYLWVDQGKHLERGMRMIQKAVDAQPENKAYRDSLGWAFYQLGRLEDALRELEIAADDEDTDGVILDHLGDAYEKIGQRDKALATWRRAAEAFERDEEKEFLKATRKKISNKATNDEVPEENDD